MGHAINYITEPENVDKKAVMASIQEVAARDGDGYPGRVKWHSELPVYESYEEAEKMIQRLDNGWYDDHAVRFYDYRNATRTKKIDELYQRIKETRDKRVAYANEHSVKNLKAEYVGCPKCGSKISRKHIGDRNRCPVCGQDLRSKTTLEKLQSYDDKIKALNEMIDVEKKKQTSARRVMWLIKYEYHC